MKQRAITGWINFAVFLILEIASLHMLAHNGEIQKRWLARGSHWVMGTVWGATQRIQAYFSLATTNQQLAQENFQLREQLLLAQEKLRQLRVDSLQLVPRPGFSLTLAEVTKMSRNKQHNYLILNRGYEDGIQEKSGIISQNGVVGIVDAVSAHYSYAFSFQNSDISISARLGSAGETGLLVWDGLHPSGAILKEIPLQQQYHPGDTVFTSGHSLLFPPDIPLGIAGASKIVNGATSEIEVRLFQDFSSVRYVTVVHNNAFDEIEEFEP